MLPSPSKKFFAPSFHYNIITLFFSHQRKTTYIIKVTVTNFYSLTLINHFLRLKIINSTGILIKLSSRTKKKTK